MNKTRQVEETLKKFNASSKFQPKYAKSEQALRRIRQKIFDVPVELEGRYSNILGYLKARVLRDRKEEIGCRPFRHWMYAAEN